MSDKNISMGLFINRSFFTYMKIRLKELESFQEKIQHEIKVTAYSIKEMEEQIEKEENIKAHIKNKEK